MTPGTHSGQACGRDRARLVLPRPPTRRPHQPVRHRPGQRPAGGVHPRLGLRSDQWTYQIPALAGAGLRCAPYDRRGHGRSDRPATGYDIDTLADDLAAVIGHFGLHEATLVSHSLGSKGAIRYLTRHGDARINRLVLIAPTTPLLRGTQVRYFSLLSRELWMGCRGVGDL